MSGNGKRRATPAIVGPRQHRHRPDVQAEAAQRGPSAALHGRRRPDLRRPGPRQVDGASTAIERTGNAERGKAIIIVNPVEPPMIMRYTVFCSVPAEAAGAGALQDKVTESIHAMVGAVRQHVPGYTLRAEPQYEADSVGALVLSDAQARVRALLGEIGDQAQAGFHGHQNLSPGVADPVPAYQADARQIDGALCALGADAGDAPTEVLAATLDRMGIDAGIDVQGVMPAAQGVVKPVIPRLPRMDRSAIVQGHAGVCSSFLLHAERASRRHGVPAHEILERIGGAGYVGGQEDMIIDIALQLAEERDLGDLAAQGVR